MKKRKSSAVVMFALGLALFLSTGQASTVRLAISSVPSQLNPFFATDSNSQNIGRLTHLSLLDLNADMEVVCRACERFEQRVDGKGHHLHFWLKRDLKFWDGSPVTSQDVERSVRMFQSEDPYFQSPFRFAFKAIDQVVVTGPLELELGFAKFDLENLSGLPLLKILKLKERVGDKGRPGKTVGLDDIVGAGPYRLEEISDYSIMLAPVRDQNLPKLHFKVVRDETTLVLKLIHKELDLSLADLSPRKFFWLEGQNYPDLKSWTSVGSNLNYIGINHQRKVFQDVRVRRALSLLVPRKDLLTYKQRNLSVLATSLLSPAFKGKSFTSRVDDYDPAAAASLLDQVGYPKGKNGVRFSLNWRVSNNKAAVEVAETIAASFEKVGINVNLMVQEWGTFYRGFKNGEYDLVSASWVGMAGPEMLRSVFHSSNFPPKGMNRGHYANKDFDRIIDQATQETIEAKRNKLYLEAQEIIDRDYPYLYLWHPKIIWPGRKCLELDRPFPNGSFLPLLSLKNHCT